MESSEYPYPQLNTFLICIYINNTPPPRNLHSSPLAIAEQSWSVAESLGLFLFTPFALLDPSASSTVLLR